MFGRVTIMVGIGPHLVMSGAGAAEPTYREQCPLSQVSDDR